MVDERVQKIICGAGFCSRRNAEKLIEEGRVSVNDKIISIGDKADSSKDIIRIDGVKLKFENKKYFVFYKPRNVLTSLSDPFKKNCVSDYFGGIKERVFPVGRLDFDAEGLLIVTNDGDFANKVMHPRYEILKTYEAELVQGIKHYDMKKFEGKIKLKDGFVKIERARLIRNDLVEITIHEGRHKVVKRIFKELGFYVRKLKRTKIGKLSLGSLKPGQIKEIPKEKLVALVTDSA